MVLPRRYISKHKSSPTMDRILPNSSLQYFLPTSPDCWYWPMQTECSVYSLSPYKHHILIKTSIINSTTFYQHDWKLKLNKEKHLEGTQPFTFSSLSKTCGLAAPSSGLRNTEEGELIHSQHHSCLCMALNYKPHLLLK